MTSFSTLSTNLKRYDQIESFNRTWQQNGEIIIDCDANAIQTFSPLKLVYAHLHFASSPAFKWIICVCIKAIFFAPFMAAAGKLWYRSWNRLFSRAKLASSSSYDPPLFDCSFSNATPLNIIRLMFCQLLHSSSNNGLQVHIRSQRDQVEQLVAVHISRIHRHFHPQLLLLRSLYAVERRFCAHFARFWLERFYGGDGKCR